MRSNRLAMDEQVSQSDPFDDDLSSLLDEYESLSDSQQAERQELLDRIDKLTEKTSKLDTIDDKLEQFTKLLLDIRSQLSGVSPEENKGISIPKPNINEQPKVVATEAEIEQLSEEVETRSEELDDEIDSLVHLLEKKKNEIQEKDRKIEELNDRLNMMEEEKGRLAAELENMNVVIDSWKSQLDLLQKLAASDPRYRVIEALKKHGSLSDIQLAFTMGTSINQLRKYIEDLIDLNLVKKSPNGRFVWTGKEFDTDIDNE